MNYLEVKTVKKFIDDKGVERTLWRKVGQVRISSKTGAMFLDLFWMEKPFHLFEVKIDPEIKE